MDVMKNFLLLAAGLYAVSATGQTVLHVGGSSGGAYKTINDAVNDALQRQNENVVVQVHKGVYYLPRNIEINAGDMKCNSLQIKPAANEQVTVSAGRPLALNWKPYRNGIYVANVPAGIRFERLYVNDVPQILARYPDYDSSAAVLNGTSPDAIKRIDKWKDAGNGYVHALHLHRWGGNSYRVSKDNNGKIKLEGGWQTNRPDGMNEKYVYVENSLEELDAPHEWFLDTKNNQLYYYPPAGIQPGKAKVVASNLKNSITLKGDATHPVRNVKIQGLRFAHNERTFMETAEPLLRSDWTIYRNGALLLDGTEDCSISDCEFEGLGGNAIMISNYSKRDTVNGCHIHHIGANAICLVGDPKVVRSARDKYEALLPYNAIDKYPGPKGENFPQHCLVTDNLVHHIGQFEKQVAGVELAICAGITVSHNSIYDVPRAGINVGDGCFGGHLIEYNDVFNTVLETSDHGAFNSWGRDRYWSADRIFMDSITTVHPELILLDVQVPVTLRNNRFRCDHGWDIDLDDGSSNYRIYNNVCLNGGIKLREGFLRVVENNIMINNTFHPHVWFRNSEDVFRHNIVSRAFLPVEIPVWGREVDYNLFPDNDALQKSQQRNTDAHSLAGDPGFTDPAKGNYWLKSNSPAFEIGFRNIPMNQFGVLKPSLKKIARQPVFPPLVKSGYDGNEYLLK